MSSSPSVAVIGAGNWGRNLVRTFAELGALRAVADSDGDRRAEVGPKYGGVTIYADYRNILGSEIDAVVIATPALTHYCVAREVLLADKDAFVENPLALRASEAEELASLAAERGRILLAGHLLIYQPAIGFIRDYVTAGEIGRLQSVHQERLNLGRVRAVENALWSLGVHDVAVVLYLVGEQPLSVCAVGQCVLQLDVEDDVYLHMEFGRGIQADLHASWLWPEKRRRLVIVGSNGMLTHDELAGEVALHRKRIGSDLARSDEGSEVLSRGSVDLVRMECQHFLECPAGRETPASDGRSAVEVVRILERAGRSLQRERASSE